MDNKLEILLADGVIDDVLGRLKSGKEADIWIVSHGGEAIAAKLYKERQARSFRNNAAYREGRVVGNSRTQRAIDKRSRFGRAAEEEAWKSAEADALYKLHAAGVSVPQPVMFYEGVLLMQLVRDAEGQPAPRLVDAQLIPERAREVYLDLRRQVVRMLDADLIHGDLSPFNVLLAARGPVIIDFPQTIAAAKNSRAEYYFERDLENLRRHLAGFDRGLEARAGDAREIWRAYVRRELTPDFEPTGKRLGPRERSAKRRSEPPAGAAASARPPSEDARRDRRRSGRLDVVQDGRDGERRGPARQRGPAGPRGDGPRGDARVPSGARPPPSGDTRDHGPRREGRSEAGAAAGPGRAPRWAPGRPGPNGRHPDSQRAPAGAGARPNGSGGPPPRGAHRDRARQGPVVERVFRLAAPDQPGPRAQPAPGADRPAGPRRQRPRSRRP
jgi:RIO kinase 1